METIGLFTTEASFNAFTQERLQIDAVSVSPNIFYMLRASPYSIPEQKNAGCLLQISL